MHLMRSLYPTCRLARHASSKLSIRSCTRLVSERTPPPLQAPQSSCWPLMPTRCLFVCALRPPHYTNDICAGNNDCTWASLQPHTHQVGSCKAGMWSFFIANVSPLQMRNNMIFELSDRNTYRFDGLQVYMYPDAVPDDMSSEFYVDFGWNGVYSLSMSSYEFEIFLDQVCAPFVRFAEPWHFCPESIPTTQNKAFCATYPLSSRRACRSIAQSGLASSVDQKTSRSTRYDAEARIVTVVVVSTTMHTATNETKSHRWVSHPCAAAARICAGTPRPGREGPRRGVHRRVGPTLRANRLLFREREQGQPQHNPPGQ